MGIYEISITEYPKVYEIEAYSEEEAEKKAREEHSKTYGTSVYEVEITTLDA